MGISGRAERPGRASSMVEKVLREQLANGTFRVGQPLPPQRQLADEFGVSRDTIQRVLRRLIDENWLQACQGSGIRVVRVPDADRAEPGPQTHGRATLGPLIHRAFEQPEVTLDTFSLTSETLVSHLRVQAERIAAGEITPARVRMRMLLPAEEPRLAYPAALAPDDERIGERWRAMAQRYAGMVAELVDGFRRWGVDAEVEIRRVAMTPQFKLYVFNDSDMLFAPYEVVRRTIPVGDAMVPALDVLGPGPALFVHHRDADGLPGQDGFFAAMRATFESYWNHLAVEG
ncbi:GntR family transcriptional regulator [Streptomyces sp. B93]|uniref:GntR family transcriptional regulator n=1 Tax=Streptomyces sp. B93 TaxID=2824875 RepID=UPI001B37154F|nr:GntR family transcriptional regulator [Streptomyces sp. B93]MBQ1089209.1 GntR family transcriptional regulator [Streptomyces sp. B93]